MANDPTFWKNRVHVETSREEREPSRADRADLETSRRDFLTRMGFVLAASAVAGCSRGAVQQAIPFLIKPEETMPGVATWYASTCAGCLAGCGLLVKTRDGRPIKIEGNPDSPRSGGGTCAAGQATVLSLYDAERLNGPTWLGVPVTWPEVDARIAERLRAVRAGGHPIVLLSSTIVSPSTRALIAEWTAQVPGFRHVVYDAVSCSALRRATRACFAIDGVPHYRFDRATTIVGMPDPAVKESLERIRTAIANCGYSPPDKRTVINLAPADIRRERKAVRVRAQNRVPPRPGYV